MAQRMICISREGAIEAAEAFKEGYPHKLDFVAVRPVYGKGGHILGWGVVFKTFYGGLDWVMEA